VEKQVIEVGIQEEDQSLIEQIGQEVVEFEGYKIETDLQYQNAVEVLKRIKGRHASVETIRKGITQPLDEVKKSVMNFFKPITDRLENAENVIKCGAIAFDIAKRKQQEEEQRKAYEAAKREEDRKRAQLEAQAQKAEAAGKIEKAQALFERAEVIHVPVSVISKETPKVSGIKYIDKWKFRVTEQSKIPREYLIVTVNERALLALAASTKGQVSIPGIEFYSERIMSAGKA